MEHDAVVFIELNGQPVPAGKIRITEEGRWSRSEFAYGRRYLARPDAVAIDPVMLPLNEKAFETPPEFPLFNGVRDAAPDAWGRKLIDRYVLRQFGRPAGEAEYLLASQHGTRIGALQFGPTPSGPGRVLDFNLPSARTDLGNLEALQRQVDAVQSEEDLPDQLVNFIAPGSDLGGARPKATVTIDGFPWLVKFGIDHERLPMEAVEAGCLDLAEMCGIDTCERQVVEIACRPALLLKRFDREVADGGELQRVHMISSLTLLGAHESDHGLSGYADIYDALRRYGAPGDHSETIYRRMVLNVLTGNTDDHYRNHAFLHGADGYRPSPVYDITPTLQTSSSRYLFLHLGKAGAGREATLEAAVAGAASLGLQPDQAKAIATEMAEIVGRNWRDVMERRGVGDDAIRLMEGSFAQAGRQLEGGPGCGM